jgi:tryptophan 2,3-dioxygenase
MNSTNVNYSDYLGLDELLTIAKPISDEPLEMMFIVAHQTTELWFKVLIQELERIDNVSLDEHPSYSPVIQLQRVVKIFEHLTTLWSIMTTMTPKEYENFRGKLGAASGMQSKQYKEVEELLRKLPKRWNHKYKYHLLDVENSFKKWQFSHMKAVERIIGYQEGTGGTSGVGYLKSAVDRPLFAAKYEWKGW